MIITTPQQLFDFLEFSDTSNYEFLAKGELVRLLLDWQAKDAGARCELSYEMHMVEETIRIVAEKKKRQYCEVWSGSQTPPSLEIYRVLLPPRGGFNETNSSPETWVIWDDETDYDDPKINVDTTPPEPDDDTLALVKHGLIIFNPHTVANFKKWKEGEQ